MSKREKIEYDLPMLDDLFSSQEQREEAKLKKIYDIPLDEIDDFPNHPFKIKDDDDMLELVESVRQYGIITPAVLRKKEDGRYEVISGHRRKRACFFAGLSTLRSEVVEMDRDEATIFMVDSNLQRSKILPSEKAFSYKMRLDAMKRQGKRLDLTSPPLGEKLRGKDALSVSMLGKEVGESREQIRRYIRLTNLVPELLEMVDEEIMALRPAVELSYLPEDLQRDLVDVIDMEQCTPSHAQALRMRKLHEKGKLDDEMIGEIMMEEKPNQKDRLIIKGDKLKRYLPGELPEKEREEYIFKALEYYDRYLKRKELKKKDRER